MKSYVRCLGVSCAVLIAIGLYFRVQEKIVRWAKTHPSLVHFPVCVTGLAVQICASQMQKTRAFDGKKGDQGAERLSSRALSFPGDAWGREP